MSRRFTNLNHARSWTFNVTTAGTAEKLGLKQIATTIAFNASAQKVTDVSGGSKMLDTITDSAKAFFTAGFRTGDQITVSGAQNAANNASFVIYDIIADGGTIILTANGVLTTEVAGNSVTITSPVTVPEGISLTIHAYKSNTQKIYVGSGKLNAQGHQCFTFSAGDTVFLQVVRSDIIWLDADVSAEGVECIVEQNKHGVE